MMDLVDTYIALRRASGFKVERNEYHLRSFARFAEARGETHIQMETAVAWAATARAPGARNARLSTLAIFARHLHLEDPGHQVPSASAFPHKQGRRLPHLYSPNEIDVLLQAAGKLSPRGSSRPATYQTLLGLLVVTGMRISEALRLTMADVTDAGLIIRETKFRKSRLLPLHDSARAALDRYRDRWRPLA